jgi:hypothetical protein
MGAATHHRGITEPKRMGLTFSSEIMRSMGFRPFESGESIGATFRSIFIYEVRGLAFEPDTCEITVGTVEGANYHVGVGAKLNETCQALTGDTYIDDEAAWAKEKRCSGPFLIIVLGPTQVCTITKGQIKIEIDGSATTFDSFSTSRSELGSLEAAALPSLITSLACKLTDPNQYLELRRLDCSIVGRTTSGQVLRDIRLKMSGEAYVSRALAPNALLDGLKGVVALAPRLNGKAARFFALGMAEEDELKKFLYFFLALEVETHAVFAQIDQTQALRKLLDPASLPIPSVVALLCRQADQLRNLYDRFIWCAACAWTGISDADVDQFKRLKATRDEIAHGRIAEPPGGSAQLVQQLARKVLRQ